MGKMVFVVDMINAFGKKGFLCNPKLMDMVPLLHDFLENFEGEKVEARDGHTEDSLEFGEYPVHSLLGDYESEGLDELKDVLSDAKVFYKNSTNLLLVPGFIDYILERKPESITVCGCCTDICIMQYALALKALFNQYNIPCEIIVYDNLVDTFDSPEHNRDYYHEAALNLMKNAGIKVKHYEKNKVIKKVGQNV